MHSEIDTLCKQLEFCLSVKQFEAAEVVAKMLIKHSAKINISLTLLYECGSHNKYSPGNSFIRTTKEDFQYFEKCNHYVCKECLRKYISQSYKISGVNFDYYCPACIEENRENMTILDYRQPYFSAVINKEEFEKELIKAKKRDEDYIISLKMTEIRRCSFHNENNISEFGEYSKAEENYSRIKLIPRCNHYGCFNCLKSYFYNCGVNGDPFICPTPGCGTDMPDFFIAEFFNYEEFDDFHILQLHGLVLKDFLYCKCPECLHNNKLDKSKKNQPCSQCSKSLCCFCGKFSHSDIICNSTSDKLGDQDFYIEYECTKDSPVPVLREYYFHALSLFEWNIEPQKVEILNQIRSKENSNNPQYEFYAKKISYIKNPKIERRYLENKASLVASGLFKGELYVFHGSEEQNYDRIFKEGLKIGGVSAGVAVKHGKRYGPGIYTGGDPVTSAFYSHSNKLIICKALMGRKAGEPASDLIDLARYQFDYYEVVDSAFQHGSRYYIFYKLEHVLPIYLIEFT